MILIRIYILVFIFLVAHSIIWAQDINTGVAFGFHMRNNVGINNVGDSVTIVALGSQNMINTYSIYTEYPISKKVQWRSSLSITDQLMGFLFYNNKISCQLCDNEKVTAVGSFNINLVNTVAINVPLSTPFNILVLGGIRTNFNFTRDKPDISFRNGTRNQGLAEAMNNMDKAIKPVYFNSVIGIKTNWRRFSLIIELDKNIGQSITRDLEMFGKKYTFLNRTNTFTMTLNYAIFPWKRKDLIEIGQ